MKVNLNGKAAFQLIFFKKEEVNAFLSYLKLVNLTKTRIYIYFKDCTLDLTGSFPWQTTWEFALKEGREEVYEAALEFVKIYENN